jgi:hypothetical protein
MPTAALKDTVESALAPLIGLAMWGLSRDEGTLVVQFGERQSVSSNGGPREAGAYTIRVACAWRLTDPAGIAAGSGDLFTPADEDADLETFDWQQPGATWCDVRLRQFEVGHTDMPLTASTFVADEVGGFRLVVTDGVELDVFPNSAAAPHVETEYWRVLREGEHDAQIVIGSFGVELEQPE